MLSNVKLIFIGVIFFVNIFFALGSDIGEIYINRYSAIAISEMQRTGIPASIKLAQGLLESDKGRSKLASVANNHFGIKCGKSWRGGKFYQQDDDYNKKGRLVNSCFRSFDSAVESYVAHSEFLLDTNKTERYGFLFDFKSSDYVSWAKGLKKSGYATDPNYPSKLIQIIRHYGLNIYDETISIKRPGSIDVERRQKDKDLAWALRKKEEIPLQGKMVRFKTVNGVKAIESVGNETVEELAERTGLLESNILMYNEFLHVAYQPIPEGTNIFLSKKRRSNKEGKKWHKVREGETMETLSQKYGIRLSTIYAINRMKDDEIPLPGEKISLAAKVKSSKTPKTKEKTGEDEFLF